MDNTVPFTPVNFFQLSSDCRRLKARGNTTFALSPSNFKQYLLPDTSMLTSEHSFAAVSVGWQPEGIEIYVHVGQPYQQSTYPQFDRGDCLEVCIDTRNVKTSGYNTRFCHHFFCLPEKVEGQQAGEVTRFRTEDAHELCSAADLQVKSHLQRDHYTLQLAIPAHCLQGFDPEQYQWLGFTYRVSRTRGAAQHFSVCADDYQYAQQPSLWGSLRLVP